MVKSPSKSPGQNSKRQELSWMLASGLKLIASGFMHPMTSTTQLPSSKVASALKLLASGLVQPGTSMVSTKEPYTDSWPNGKLNAVMYPVVRMSNWNWPAWVGVPTKSPQYCSPPR